MKLLPFSRVFFIIAAALVFIVGPVAVQAQDMGALKQRMTQRLPSLDALKASGAVGENNRGLVEVRAAKDDAAKVVAEENADRQAVYAAIAKQTGSTAAAVGQARAKQIATASKPGVWLQNEKGEWYRK
ncbi:hypothetical protein OpiT1DRAFT_05116 [Opitutaceae bacterium TAV1]|nr:hypothetical protein OpiT1DRAFT_05116 [Opitutaceae bacterium TAV1]